MEQELADEVGSYLDLLIKGKITAGMGPQEARRAAQIELGVVT